MEKDSLRFKVIDHIVRFSFGNTIKSIGQFINQYVAAFILGPAIFGVWQGVKLVLSYGTCVDLGTTSALYREVPLLRGKGEQEKIREIKDASFTFTLGGTVILAFVLFLSTFFLRFSIEAILSLRFVALILLLQFLRGFYETWLKAHHEFGIISKIAIIDGVGSVLSLFLIFSLSFLGFLIGQTIVAFVCALYAYVKSKCRINFVWNSTVLKNLIVIGFPIMLIIFSGELFNTADRFFILRFLNSKMLGVYSLGILAFMPINFLFYSANSVMYPRFSERFGATQKSESLKKFITFPIEIFSLIIPVLIGEIVVILPALVELFLPKYTEGIDAARIVLFGLFFSSIVGMIGNFFLSTNRQYLYLKILLSGVILNVILCIVLLQLNFGIVGVAIGKFVSYFFFFVVTVVAALHYCGVSGRESAGFILKTCLPVVYVIITSSLIPMFININNQTILSVAMGVALQSIIFLILNSYLLILFFKKAELKKYALILWRKGR